MISLDKAKVLLEQQEGVADIEVRKDAYLLARFPNKVDPGEPHHLVVHPVEEKQILKVVVPSIAEIRSGNAVSRVLANLNFDMLLGKVGMDEEGEVRFEINQACRDGEMDDPSPEIFARLIEVAVEMATEVTFVVTEVGMVEAGVPKDVARGFVKQLRQQDEEAGEEQDTL